ncbi:hypothetical protein KO561_14270 [Radiobacillus kanasensis]|uniref:hypothetical protein n=1 Tax=Radiobacillus kanasensis TaxID=2844358 RepID=UPI001E3A5283|nr:hypothetical protein [Radiobacillus kanasensis]UFT98359.1 hypothetical protein KO561_14270 [Radiobacillus kanasensis]
MKKKIAGAVFIIAFTLLTLYTDYKNDRKESELRNQALEGISMDNIGTALESIKQFKEEKKVGAQSKNLEFLYKAQEDLENSMVWTRLYEINDKDVGTSELRPLLKSYVTKLNEISTSLKNEWEVSQKTWDNIQIIESDLKYIQSRLNNEEVSDYDEDEFHNYIENVKSQLKM